MSREQEIIEKLRARTPCQLPFGIGIGDDCAVLDLLQARSLVTCDMLMEGVHFNRTLATDPQIGRKALAVSLSDIAAMAGSPVAAFVSLALPERNAVAVADGIMDGILSLAADFGTVVAGGDTNIWAGPLVINVTVIGREHRLGSVLRKGARPGDCVLVTGVLGGSISGHHLDFKPRVHEAVLLADRYGLSSMTDLSDGLASDLQDIADESGVGFLLDRDQIPVSAGARQTSDPIKAALCDGEDFELCFTAPPDVARRMVAEQPLADVSITMIGRAVDAPGIYWREDAGEPTPILWSGFKY